MKHKMMNVLMLLLFCFGSNYTHGQEAVLTSGGNATGSNGTVYYSIGQVAYTTLMGTTTVAMGVQQPIEITTSVGEEQTGIDLQALAYPNPTSRMLTLNIVDYAAQNLSYKLIDMTGKVILSGPIVQENTLINMEQFSTAVYFLKVEVENNNMTEPLKVFRIIKN